MALREIFGQGGGDGAWTCGAVKSLDLGVLEHLLLEGGKDVCAGVFCCSPCVICNVLGFVAGNVGVAAAGGGSHVLVCF